MTDADPDSDSSDDDGTTDVHRRDLADVAFPSEAVVELVAEATDTDPLDLPVLHESVDTDALDALFGAEGPVEGVTVTFGYGPVEVTIESGSHIEVRPAAD